MRPTLTEQLGGMKRILSEVVLVQVRDEYAVTALRGVIESLDMLEKAWPRTKDFLVWDVAETERLLTEFAGLAPPALEDEIRQLLASGIGERDKESLDQHDTELRARLTELIGVLEAAGTAGVAATEAVMTHLRERTRRNPYQMLTVLPSASTQSTGRGNADTIR